MYQLFFTMTEGISKGIPFFLRCLKDVKKNNGETSEKLWINEVLLKT